MHFCCSPTAVAAHPLLLIHCCLLTHYCFLTHCCSPTAAFSPTVAGYYSDPNFDTKSGAQLQTVLAMVDDLPNAVREAVPVLVNATAETVFSELRNTNSSAY